ncbi:MAG TPA: MutS family DNA mismatch repair protein [Polyangiaceae bacterium]|nr:MutS family DNA mismatch repair protein [Polyangiaceae bacterium]
MTDRTGAGDAEHGDLGRGDLEAREAQARAAYQGGQAEQDRVVAALEARSRLLGAARLGIAAAALALLGGLVWARPGAWAAETLAGLGVLFAALVVVHARTEEASRRALATRRFHARGLARMSHDWPALAPADDRFRSTDHPFTGDLDIFGAGSIMQLVDATETRFGQERLAALLALRSVNVWPGEVIERAQAARELSARFAFRERLATATGVLAEERPDPSPLLRWAEGSDAAWTERIAWVAWLLPAVVGAAIVAGLGGALSIEKVGVAALLVGAVGLWLGVRLSPMLESVSAGESSATRWRAAIEAIESETFRAPLLVRLREQLAAAPRSASSEMAALARIVGFVDARRNEAFRFFVAPLLFWDLHGALALVRWRKRAGLRVRSWLQALGELEALASLGAFAFEHPGFCWPEPVGQAMLEARALGHPLIAGDRRVGNDVRLPSAGRALVVTGSNMSGKSTLLRAIGVNVVLARAGAPVCARSMRFGPMRVATSMRVEDSLSRGVSHFYAELQRLKQIVDWAQESGEGPVLFLLDEILQGTNSRERVAGARDIVRELLSTGALGAVSTHDLGITALAEELSDRVENVHFEEQVSGTTMTFDYVLRPGVVQSSNALRLMRAMGLAVSENS